MLLRSAKEIHDRSLQIKKNKKITTNKQVRPKAIKIKRSRFRIKLVTPLYNEEGQWTGLDVTFHTYGEELVLRITPDYKLSSQHYFWLLEMIDDLAGWRLGTDLGMKIWPRPVFDNNVFWDIRESYASQLKYEDDRAYLAKVISMPLAGALRALVTKHRLDHNLPVSK